MNSKSGNLTSWNLEILEWQDISRFKHSLSFALCTSQHISFFLLLDKCHGDLDLKYCSLLSLLYCYSLQQHIFPASYNDFESQTSKLGQILTNIMDWDKPNNRQGAVHKIKCNNRQVSCFLPNLEQTPDNQCQQLQALDKHVLFTTLLTLFKMLRLSKS